MVYRPGDRTVLERTSDDPDVFIESLATDMREDMRLLDNVISDAMTDETRALWQGTFWGGSDQSIIGYGDLTSARSRGKSVDWFKVGLPAQKSHISIYVNAADRQGYLVRKYADRLGKVKVGSASIGFKGVDDIDLDVLRELIQVAREQMA